MHDEKLLTLNELADRTGLPAAWLKREADARRVPCLRAGRRRMFDLAAVRVALALLASRGPLSSTSVRRRGTR